MTQRPHHEAEAGDDVVLLAVGDLHPSPHQDAKEIYAHCADLLRAGDITFAQLEVLFTEKGTLQSFPSARWFVRLPSADASSLSHAGFDVVSCASNHAGDWGNEALLDSIGQINSQGVLTAGAGSDLQQARQPAILERGGTRVAFLAYTSVAPPGCYALPDKPGIAPMRASTYYEPLDGQPGTPPRVVTIPVAEDLEAIVEDVRQVRESADVVIVSLHWGVHFVPKEIAEYQPIVAHAVIDAGADLILGHHPHILKAVETYKEKVIFYSIGNFARGSNRAHWGDKDRLRRQGRHRAMSDNYQYTALRLLRADPAIQALEADYDSVDTTDHTVKTVIVKALIRDGTIKRVSFLPTWIINDRTQPLPLDRSDPRFGEVVDYFDWVSSEFPHKFSVDGNEVVVETTGFDA